MNIELIEQERQFLIEEIEYALKTNRYVPFYEKIAQSILEKLKNG